MPNATQDEKDAKATEIATGVGYAVGALAAVCLIAEVVKIAWLRAQRGGVRIAAMPL